MSLLSDIRAIIWDLDGTLYRFDEAMTKACNIAAARTVQSLGISITYDEAVVMAARSEEEHGYSLHAFIHEHGIRYEDMHHPFHEFIDEKLIRRNDELVARMECLSIPQVIITNASRGWATRALTHLGMKHIFTDDRIIPMEDANFEPKATSRRGFDKAVSILGILPEHILMIEDLARNLRIPKDMGMQTAFIHHGIPAEKFHDYIDFQAADPLMILNAIDIN